MKHCKWNVCSAVWSIWHSSHEEIECREWHKSFKEGRENIEDVEGSCYPEMHRSDKNTSTLVRQDTCLTWSDKANQPARPIYSEVLVRLHEAVSRKGPELWPNNWFFHHNWSTLLSVLSRRLWEKRCCWTGTAPLFTRLCMWLFPKLMSTLKEWRF